MNKLTETEIALSVANGDLWIHIDSGYKFLPIGYERRKDSYLLSASANWYDTRRCKPYKYTLDYLTKEIVHKGERFVPIVKIQEIQNHRESSVGVYEIHSENAGLLHTCYFKLRDISVEIYEIDCDKIDDSPSWIIKQLQEWHFALDEKEGTFIPVTEENNPYL